MGRKKVVPIEGKEYKIGALTFDQLQEYLTPVNTEELTPSDRSKKMYDHAIEMVCNGLNNGILDPEEMLESNTSIENPWTVAKFRSICDRVVFEKLNEAIIIFSGLSIDDKSGETQAAAAQTLTTSAPA